MPCSEERGQLLGWTFANRAPGIADDWGLPEDGELRTRAEAEKLAATFARNNVEYEVVIARVVVDGAE